MRITKEKIAAIALSVFCLGSNIGIVAQKLESKGQVSRPQASNEFLSADAFSDGRGSWIKWQVFSERQILGFNVYRVRGDRRELANEHLIGAGFFPAGDEAAAGRSYTFFDSTGGFTGSYVIESVGLFGENTESQAISVRYVDDLAEIAGRTYTELLKDRLGAEPVIERNKPVLPEGLEKGANNNLLPPNPDVQRYLAGQPGVRIGAKKEGIYRVTRAELQTAGFDVNGPFDNWQLYRNGNEQSIVVGNNGDYIEFYGNGIDTVESGQQTYFLINGAGPGKRVALSYQRGFAGSVIGRSYQQAFSRVDRILYFSTLRNGEGNNYVSDKVVNTAGASIVFSLDGIDFDLRKVALDVKVQGLTFTPHNIEVTLNGEQLGFITGNNTQLMTGHFEIPTSLLIEGSNTVLLKVPSAPSDVSFFDSVKVHYGRLYKAKQNALSYYTNPYRKSVVSGFSSQNIRVFDIANPDDPTLISSLSVAENNGDFSVTLPANRPKVMFAVEDSAVLPAASISLNTPSTLATANHNAGLVIISYKDWLTEAETWANYRRNQGLTVEVVRIDDVFDEFNYGIVNTNAIRAFLQYAVSNWQTPPSYLLILGDATNDPRNYLGLGDFNYVPTKMIDTLYEETGSDEAMADFNDDGLAEISVGRIPARTGAAVTQNLNKVMVFEPTAGQGLSRGALFVSDLPEGYDFAAMSQRIASGLPPGTPLMMLNRGEANSRANLLAALDTGKFLVNYSGHGSTGIWATSSFYGLTDPLNMANGNNLTIFTMLTCLNGYFLSPTTDSLSEYALRAPNGGGVAVWSSTGKTTPDVQEVLARRFYQQLGVGNMTRIGDLIRDAKQAVVGGRDVRLSWALLGDPTLKVR